MNDLKYTKTHEWLKKDGEEFLVGITNHAQELLGDMVFVELPDIGMEVEAGGQLGVVESVKAASDFYAPISGQVSAINPDLNTDPALVNKDPYQSGWLVRLKPSNLNEIETLLTHEQYESEIIKD